MDDEDEETQQYEDSESTNLDHSCQREVTTSAVPTSGDDRPASSRRVTPSLIAPQLKQKKKLTPADEVLHLAGQQLKAIRPDNEFEAYGKYIAHKLRSLKGNQAVFVRKLINDVIFEGELEALTKDFKVINSQPLHSFETNDLLQFSPQLYHSTYIPRRFEHQLSNMPMPNSQHISNTTSPYSHINKLEKANSEQPNIQQTEINLNNST